MTTGWSQAVERISVAVGDLAIDSNTRAQLEAELRDAEAALDSEHPCYRLRSAMLTMVDQAIVANEQDEVVAAEAFVKGMAALRLMEMLDPTCPQLMSE